MLIVAMSDSHGDREAVARAVEENPGARMFIHLGDGRRDCEDVITPPGAVFYRLRGNCDLCCDASELLLDEADGVKLLAVHGHRFGVKLGTQRLLAEAARLGAGAALYGHTHEQSARQEGGIWLINPGALSERGEYAVLTVENGALTPQLRRLK